MGNSEYIQRINQAIDYIHKNLDKNLTAEEIADHCCFSRFYFNRMFKAVVNESIYSFIKRRKLENAAFLLTTKRDMPITEIALRNGYSPSNFATAFKDYHGMSATQYRKNNEIPSKDTYIEVTEHIKDLKKMTDSFAIVNNKTRICKIAEMSLLYERFIGNYYDLADCWDGFCSKMTEKNLVNNNTRFIGISYDDPFIIDEDRCIYDMCIEVESVVGSNVHKVEEGYYVCYEFHDKISNLAKAYQEIFSIWMPFCGYDLEHRLPLEIYYSAVDETGRVRVDICIPIVKDDN